MTASSVHVPIDIARSIVQKLWKQVCPVYTERDAYQDTCRFAESTGYATLLLLEKNQWNDETKQIVDSTKTYNQNDIYRFLGVHNNYPLNRLNDWGNRINGDLVRSEVRKRFQDDPIKWLQFYLCLNSHKSSFVNMNNANIIPEWFLQPLFPIHKKVVPSYSIIVSYDYITKCLDYFNFDERSKIMSDYTETISCFIVNYKDKILDQYFRRHEILLYDFVKFCFDPVGYIAQKIMKMYIMEIFEECDAGKKHLTSNLGISIVNELITNVYPYESSIMIRAKEISISMISIWQDPKLVSVCTNYVLKGDGEPSDIVQKANQLEHQIEAYKERALAYNVLNHPKIQSLLQNLDTRQMNPNNLGMSIEDLEELTDSFYYCVLEQNFYDSCRNLRLKPLEFDIELSEAFGLEDELTNERTYFLDYISKGLDGGCSDSYNEYNIQEARNKFDRLMHLRNSFAEHGLSPRIDSFTCNNFVIHGNYKGPYIHESVLNKINLKYDCGNKFYTDDLKKLIIVATEMVFLYKKTDYPEKREFGVPSEQAKLSTMQDIVEATGKKIREIKNIPPRLVYIYECKQRKTINGY